MYFEERVSDISIWTNWHIYGWIGLGLFVFVAFLMWVLPMYGVWAAHKSGQADLAQAQNEQQVQVAQARGRKEAATLNKEAAIIEAEAVAKSVETIGKSLEGNIEYLQWQWINMMEQRDAGDTIYVPTEAGLPILEAARKIK